MIRAGVRTDSMIGVAKFRTFIAYSAQRNVFDILIFENAFGLTWAISCARSYRTLRDGSFGDAFPGTSCQATIGVVPPGRVLADALGHDPKPLQAFLERRDLLSLKKSRNVQTPE